MKKTFKLEDLDCANCAAKMEAAVKKLPGEPDGEFGHSFFAMGEKCNTVCRIWAGDDIISADMDIEADGKHMYFCGNRFRRFCEGGAADGCRWRAGAHGGGLPRHRGNDI